MLIEQLTLKNFRCFKNYSLDFSSNIACIVGPNGSGKSSILEALHYACYLRSFRTHIPRELVSFDDENFFIRVKINESIDAVSLPHELTMGFSKKSGLLKLISGLSPHIKTFQSFIELLHLLKTTYLLSRVVLMGDGFFLIKLLH